VSDDLYVEEGYAGALWLISRSWGTAIAVCEEFDGQWFAAEDDGFDDPIGPFSSLDALIEYAEKHNSFF
jgi:hypothetical protein